LVMGHNTYSPIFRRVKIVSRVCDYHRY